jgi:hypothetical protein
MTMVFAPPLLNEDDDDGRHLRLLFCFSLIMLMLVIHQRLHLHLLPHLCRHTLPLIVSLLFGWLTCFPVPQPDLPLVVPPPGASLPPFITPSPFLTPLLFGWLSLCLAPCPLPPSFRHDSSRCRLSSHPSRSVGVLHFHCPAAYHTDGCRVASCHVTAACYAF